MFRVSILKNNGEIISNNFKNKESADTWILEEAEKGIKKAIILNKETKKREIENFERNLNVDNS
jgi:hypothetical protein